ncbi:unnamed protein product (macronuclear) [Paramecium tetraurelia]|uniref:Transmembrane protein n=1 Tax=Paramecium tetraurelia TaxID=5888 RepID=A0BIU0_PARTE|nr:uncharacterized protein GSPATT00004829001 [Paramecium tetraurelia]CAK58457.1 unnamed protein product [Paramecium tetraurelia]|eukprot:XP_001425855.1 hypothetical protein (macronuclear) [Paramecium tetraurelia strain d4-2]
MLFIIKNFLYQNKNNFNKIECFKILLSFNHPQVKLISNKQENRDKLLKFLQNWQLLQSYRLIGYNNEESEMKFSIYCTQYVQLYIEQLYICRRLFRLGKSLQTILNIFEKKNLQSPKKAYNKIPHAVNQMTTYSVYIFYFFFHLIENIMVIHQLGFFEKKFNHKLLKITSHTFWALGLLTQLIYYLNRLRSAFRRELELKSQIQNGMTNGDFLEQLKSFSKERYQYGLLILRIIGDLACAMQKAQIPEKILHTRFNRGLVACGGMLSSIIQIYLQASKINKKQNVIEV